MHRPLFVFLILFTVSPTRGNDEIIDLPGLPSKPSFKQYSGYLNAAGNKFLHYWFVESASNPAKDPLLLWLNGGPGCSSLEGFLSEHGPFHVITGTKKLFYNKHSWNTVANVLYLESPIGVGFSYSTDKNYATDDDKVSLENYEALQDFFKKFPQFRNNDFYITGESYGGIYVPTLSVRVLTGSAKINFKGFAVGNGLSSARLNDDSVVFFLYYHGLFGKTSWDQLSKYCCKGGIATRENCNFHDNLSANCSSALNNASSTAHASGLINPYNIYDTCDNSGSSRLKTDLKYFFKNAKFSHFLLNSKLPKSGIPCITDTDLSRYLNEQSVRSALHIPRNVQNWTLCSNIEYKVIYKDVTPQYNLLLGKVRGLVYNGDIDSVCNFLGDQWFVDDLNRKVLTDYTYWKVGRQVGGFVKRFDHLDFVTIRGAGHMVPGDKPKESLQMITRFLTKQPY